MTETGNYTENRIIGQRYEILLNSSLVPYLQYTNYETPTLRLNISIESPLAIEWSSKEGQSTIHLLRCVTFLNQLIILAPEGLEQADEALGKILKDYSSSTSALGQTSLSKELREDSAVIRAEKEDAIKIPASSPIYPLQNLQQGWDGYWADPLPHNLLIQAHSLWEFIKASTPQEIDLPSISPTANASVAFTWSRYYPQKELEVWLYEQPDFCAEWLLSIGDNEEEGVAKSQMELLEVIKRFRES